MDEKNEISTETNAEPISTEESTAEMDCEDDVDVENDHDTTLPRPLSAQTTETEEIDVENKSTTSKVLIKSGGKV
jgi:hypothetical protein